MLMLLLLPETIDLAKVESPAWTTKQCATHLLAWTTAWDPTGAQSSPTPVWPLLDVVIAQPRENGPTPDELAISIAEVATQGHLRRIAVVGLWGRPWSAHAKEICAALEKLELTVQGAAIAQHSGGGTTYQPPEQRYGRIWTPVPSGLEALMDSVAQGLRELPKRLFIDNDSDPVLAWSEFSCLAKPLSAATLSNRPLLAFAVGTNPNPDIFLNALLQILGPQDWVFLDRHLGSHPRGLRWARKVLDVATEGKLYTFTSASLENEPDWQTVHERSPDVCNHPLYAQEKPQDAATIGAFFENSKLAEFLTKPRRNYTQVASQAHSEASLVAPPEVADAIRDGLSDKELKRACTALGYLCTWRRAKKPELERMIDAEWWVVRSPEASLRYLFDFGTTVLAFPKLDGLHTHPSPDVSASVNPLGDLFSLLTSEPAPRPDALYAEYASKARSLIKAADDEVKRLGAHRHAGTKRFASAVRSLSRCIANSREMPAPELTPGQALCVVYLCAHLARLPGSHPEDYPKLLDGGHPYARAFDALWDAALPSVRAASVRSWLTHPSGATPSWTPQRIMRLWMVALLFARP